MQKDDLHTLPLARLPSDEKADISYIGMGEYLHKTGNTFGNCVENTGGGPITQRGGSGAESSST